MGRRLALGTVLGLILGLPCAGNGADEDRKASARPTILAHYMPWFEAKPTSGKWGWHWTMNRLDPERTDRQGKREIAAYDYPLIGPYDSADPDVLEYHALLFRVTGIDGVIVDWYGSEDFNDYAMIHRRAAALFDVLARRGLKFAVCYEDRVLRAMAERSKLTPEQVIEHGKTHLRFCAEHWFGRPSYATVEGKPLLLVFGPEFLRPPQWEAVLAGLRPSPAFFTLHERKPPAIGSYAWPPMWAADKDGVLTVKALDAYLDRFARQDGLKIGCAFPGFDDFYKEAGVEPLHRYLDPRDGATFAHTLERALALGGLAVQIATWNDFGEGTTIEPAQKYGYRYLEMLQEARRKFPGEPFAFGPDDLRLPLRVYQLRKRLAPAAPARQALDAAVDQLFTGQADRARKQIGALETPAP